MRTDTGTPVIEALLSRRSIRFGFEDRPVERKLLEDIVRCGQAAPSSKNAQPWRFHVITNSSLQERLATAIASSEGLESYVPHDPRTGKPIPGYTSTVMDSVAVLRAVPATIWIENLGSFSQGRRTLLEVAPDNLSGSLVGYTLEIIGIGAAIENLWIAAHGLGLSVAFIGEVAIAERSVQSLLGIRGDVMGALALGYSQVPARPPMDPKSFADVDRVVWYE